MKGTDKGLSWCPICRGGIGAYNKAIVDGDRDAAQAALDEYIDHRLTDPKHRQGGNNQYTDFAALAVEGIARCRAVLAATPNRALRCS